jgi:hypothetical protein
LNASGVFSSLGYTDLSISVEAGEVVSILLPFSTSRIRDETFSSASDLRRPRSPCSQSSMPESRCLGKESLYPSLLSATMRGSTEEGLTYL